MRLTGAEPGSGTIPAMKKIVALVAALALTVPLAACGRPAAESSNLPASQPPVPVVAQAPATADPAAAQADITTLDALLANVDSALTNADAAPADAD
jgi:ABC-type oligopeptide transport system substrate-binding subunit